MSTLHHLLPHLPSPLAWPRTRSGIFAAWLGFLGIGLAILNRLNTSDGTQAELLQLEVVLLIIVAPVTLTAAIIAAFRDHERSIFVWIPIVLATVFLGFMFFELTFPRA